MGSVSSKNIMLNPTKTNARAVQIGQPHITVIEDPRDLVGRPDSSWCCTSKWLQIFAIITMVCSIVCLTIGLYYLNVSHAKQCDLNSTTDALCRDYLQIDEDGFQKSARKQVQKQTRQPKKDYEPIV